MFDSEDKEKFDWFAYLATVVVCWGFITYKIIRGMKLGLPGYLVIPGYVALFAAPAWAFLLSTVIILRIHLYIEFGRCYYTK